MMEITPKSHEANECSVTGVDKIAIQKDVVDELYSGIPEKWLHIIEDNTDDIEDKKKQIFSFYLLYFHRLKCK
uniref:Uncharacterized protein n=1 Tax=Strongyloides venezuelensis TaxID=75913 RepID=A0A0K0G613_STRVS